MAFSPHKAISRIRGRQVAYTNAPLCGLIHHRTDLGNEIEIHRRQCANAIPTKTWSQETASLARNWLRKCLDKHTGCRKQFSRDGQHQDRSRLPTRIIQVQRTEAGVIKARLCLTEDLPPDFRYLTLSHCWGPRSFLVLTQANYEILLKEIPTWAPDFNQCFKDAMEVTADLGYQYVWIDSLCIIQDAPGARDWVRECPRVGYIYANGDCNLSATGFRTGLEGMVVERNPAVLAPCPITIPKARSFYVYQSMIPDADIIHPLLSRGWVIQEHVLVSTRKLLPLSSCSLDVCSNLHH